MHPNNSTTPPSPKGSPVPRKPRSTLTLASRYSTTRSCRIGTNQLPRSNHHAAFLRLPPVVYLVGGLDLQYFSRRPFERHLPLDDHLFSYSSWALRFVSTTCLRSRLDFEISQQPHLLQTRGLCLRRNVSTHAFEEMSDDHSLAPMSL